MLDIDDKSRNQVIHEFRLRWPFVSAWLEVMSVDAWLTTHGWHVRLFLRNHIPDLMLVRIQLLLGSDLKREALNLRRVLDGELCWNVLFSEKRHIAGRETIDIISEEKPDPKLTGALSRIVERGT